MANSLVSLAMAFTLGTGLAWYKVPLPVSLFCFYFFALFWQARNHLFNIFIESKQSQVANQVIDSKAQVNNSVKRIVLMSLVFALGFINACLRQGPSSRMNKPVALCLQAVVLEPAQEKSHQNHTFRARVAGLGKILVKLKPASSLPEAGDTVYLAGKLSSIHKSASLTDLDGWQQQSENYFRSQGLNFVLNSAEVLKLQSEMGNCWDCNLINGLYGFRAQFLLIHQSLLKSQESAIMQRLIFGTANAGGLDYKTNQSIKNLGLSHVFAVSGLHLTALVFFLYFLLGFLKLPNWVKISVILLVITFYSALSSWTPSIARAWAMSCFVLLGRLINKKAKLLNVLLVSLLLSLLLDPNCIGDIGFQFSYLATFGIVLWANKIVDKCIFVPRSWMEPFAASLAAQALVLPLQIYYFQNLPIYFLIANLVAVPLTSFLLLCGLITSLLSLFGSFGWLLASGLSVFSLWLIKLLLFYIQFLDSWPFSGIALKKPSLVMVICIYLLLCYFAFFRSTYFFKRNAKHFVLALCVLMFALLCFRPSSQALQFQSFSHKTYEAIIVKYDQNIFKKNQTIFICNSKGKYAASDHLERLFNKQKIRQINVWVGNCPKPRTLAVSRVVHSLNQEFWATKELSLKVQSAGVLLSYKKFKALVLFQPAKPNHEDLEFYSLLKLAFHAGDYASTLWSELPKAQVYFAPHASKEDRAKLQTTLPGVRVYDSQELKSLAFETDGHHIFGLN